MTTDGDVLVEVLCLVGEPHAPVARPERADREGDSQPLPVVNEHPDVQSAVIADIEARREVGIRRYGTALQPHNGRDALRDMYEELLDAACYLKQRLIEDEEEPLRAISTALARVRDDDRVARHSGGMPCASCPRADQVNGVVALESRCPWRAIAHVLGVVNR